jgi:hypothetical protein
MFGYYIVTAPIFDPALMQGSIPIVLLVRQGRLSRENPYWNKKRNTQEKLVKYQGSVFIVTSFSIRSAPDRHHTPN